MFLAPLNYDKYFNKVFSNERISKRFLEDFQEYMDDEIFVCNLQPVIFFIFLASRQDKKDNFAPVYSPCEDYSR